MQTAGKYAAAYLSSCYEKFSAQQCKGHPLPHDLSDKGRLFCLSNDAVCGIKSVVAYVTSCFSAPPFQRFCAPKMCGKRTHESPPAL